MDHLPDCLDLLIELGSRQPRARNAAAGTSRSAAVPISEIIVHKQNQGLIKHERENRVEINAIDNNRFIELTIDSGAAETVTGKDQLPQFKTLSNPNDERTSYVLPSGAELKHNGEKRVNIVTEEGSKCTIRMQVTDINKSLMSVSRICDTGHRVTFDSDGGVIEHIETGQQTRFQRKGGVYVLRAALDAADFH